MSVKTKAVLVSEMGTELASASNITAAELRPFLNDVIDSYENFIGSYTTVQILAIASPTLRQIVFDTTLNTYYFYDGTRWVEWSRPKYKVYVALLTQTGTSAPTAVVLENTLGGTVVWTRASEGSYAGTLLSTFTDNKTLCFVSGIQTSADAFVLAAARTSDDIVNIVTRDDAGAFTDMETDQPVSIEIRVYY